MNVVFTESHKGVRLHKEGCRFAKTGQRIVDPAMLDSPLATCCRLKPEHVEAARAALTGDAPALFDAPAEEAPAATEAPAAEAPADETTADEAPADETTADETTVEAPADETTVEAPADEPADFPELRELLTLEASARKGRTRGARKTPADGARRPVARDSHYLDRQGRDVRELPGVVRARRSRATKALVLSVNVEQFGHDLNPEEGKWAAVCIDHGEAKYTNRRREATYSLPHPEEWCGKCRDLLAES